MRKFKITLCFSVSLLLVSSLFASDKKKSENQEYKGFEKSVEYTLSLTNSNSKDYFDKAIDAMKKGDDDTFFEITEKWEKETPDDPDLAVCYYNLYMNKAITPVLVPSPTPPADGSEYIQMQDENGDPVYVYQAFKFDLQMVEKSTEYLEKALVFHPDRIDIWFGLINSYLQSGLYSKAEETLLSCFEQEKLNGNKWLWMLNEPLPYNDDKYERELEFINSVHDYIAFLHMQPEKETYDLAINISKQLLELFPENPVIYNLVAVDQYKLGHTEKCIEYLNKAYKLDPTDLVVIGNLAYFNALQGNKKEFDTYIDLLKNSGDEQYIEFADSLLDNFFVK